LIDTKRLGEEKYDLKCCQGWKVLAREDEDGNTTEKQQCERRSSHW
jgi:hypothetical protein